MFLLVNPFFCIHFDYNFFVLCLLIWPVIFAVFLNFIVLCVTEVASDCFYLPVVRLSKSCRLINHICMFIVNSSCAFFYSLGWGETMSFWRVASAGFIHWSIHYPSYNG